MLRRKLRLDPEGTAVDLGKIDDVGWIEKVYKQQRQVNKKAQVSEINNNDMFNDSSALRYGRENACCFFPTYRSFPKV